MARLCSQMLPQIASAGLADAVDAFMEGIAFSGGQTARVFEVAKRLGLPIKLHADQLSNLGGAVLAARYGALSADHLEYTDEAGGAARRGRHAGARQVVRSRHLERRAAGGAALSHGLQPAACAGVEGRVSPITLRPGHVGLGDLRALYRGAEVALDPGSAPAIEA